MPDPQANLEKTRRYLKAVEDGDATYVLSLFSPDAYVDQLPNKIYPHGLRATVSQIPESFGKRPQDFCPPDL